jgi:hypothetical protein
MSKKYRIRGKIYYFIKELPNKDTDFIKFMYEVQDTKKNIYTLIKTLKRYALYKGDKKILDTYSISEVA